jgi:hypothetical protein
MTGPPTTHKDHKPVSKSSPYVSGDGSSQAALNIHLESKKYIYDIKSLRLITAILKIYNTKGFSGSKSL